MGTRIQIELADPNVSGSRKVLLVGELPQHTTMQELVFALRDRRYHVRDLDAEKAAQDAAEKAALARKRKAQPQANPAVV